MGIRSGVLRGDELSTWRNINIYRMILYTYGKVAISESIEWFQDRYSSGREQVWDLMKTRVKKEF